MEGCCCTHVYSWLGKLSLATAHRIHGSRPLCPSRTRHSHAILYLTSSLSRLAAILHASEFIMCRFHCLSALPSEVALTLTCIQCTSDLDSLNMASKTQFVTPLGSPSEGDSARSSRNLRAFFNLFVISCGDVMCISLFYVCKSPSEKKTII